MKDSLLVAAAIYNEIPLTLIVRGCKVSGVTVTTKEYFDNALGAAQLFENACKLMPDSPPPKAEGAGTTEDPLRIPMPEFIHLRDAQFWEPGCPPMPEQGGYARIALDSIDGFIFGKFGLPKT